MNNQDSWVLDRESLLATVELDAGDRAIFAAEADHVLAALAAVVPPERVETEAADRATSASAPLLIARKRYHLNVSGPLKQLLVGACTILAKSFVLDKAKLIESGVSLGAEGLVNLLGSLTRLSDRQQKAVAGLCDVIRKKKLPYYSPSTKDLAKHLNWKPEEVEATLKPIEGRVVRFDTDAKTWSLIL